MRMENVSYLFCYRVCIVMCVLCVQEVVLLNMKFLTQSGHAQRISLVILEWKFQYRLATCIGVGTSELYNGT